MSRRRTPPDRPTRGLLGDLESIRSLLDEEGERDAGESVEGQQDPQGAAERSEGGNRDESRSTETPGGMDCPRHDEDEDVPLLEDVVRGGVSVNEAFLSGEGEFTESAGESGLNEEIFKALLSDEWRESARGLLNEARAAIEEHQTEWTPAHTDELNEALKVRIDETLQQWLRQVVESRMDELRREILTVVSAQLRATVEEQFKPNTHEDPDGQ